MCGQNCMCKNQQPEVPAISDLEKGYIEGFTEARRVFWEVFQLKASDALMISNTLKKLDESSIEAQGLDILYSAYLHAADCIARDKREYPGYVTDDIERVDWSSFE